MTPAQQATLELGCKAAMLDGLALGEAIQFPIMKENLEKNGKGESGNGEERMLPHIEEGEQLEMKEVAPRQHFTQPPPRYNEATLVKALDENCVGRPSTYASIISTIVEKEYVLL